MSEFKQWKEIDFSLMWLGETKEVLHAGRVLVGVVHPAVG